MRVLADSDLILHLIKLQKKSKKNLDNACHLSEIKDAHNKTCNSSKCSSNPQILKVLDVSLIGDI